MFKVLKPIMPVLMLLTGLIACRVSPSSDRSIVTHSGQPIAKTVFNFITKQPPHWEKIQAHNPPPSRIYAMSWFDGTYAYIYGGLSGHDFSVSNDLWQYNSTTESWVRIILTNAPKISNAVTWFDGHYAYIFGGHNEHNVAVNTLWKYNITAQTLTEVTPTTGTVPSARLDTVAWYDGHYAYVFAGATNNNPYNDLWKYDTTQNYWQEMITAHTPLARYGASAWFDGKNAYVFAGHSTNSTNDLWKYDGVDWTQVGLSGSCPSARNFATSWYDNAYGYTFGGANSQPLNDLWRYNVLSDRWESVSTTPPISYHYGSTSWLDKDHSAYVFGGFNNSSAANDLWRFVP